MAADKQADADDEQKKKVLEAEKLKSTEPVKFDDGIDNTEEGKKEFARLREKDFKK